VRISPPTVYPNEISADERDDYEHVLSFVARQVQHQRRAAGEDGASGGEPTPVTVGGYWGALLNSPGLARRLAEMGAFYGQAEARGSFSNRDRELTDLMIGREVRWNVGFKGHISIALASGVEVETMRALLDGRHDDLTVEDLELLEFIRQVLTHTVTDEGFAGIVKRYGERGAVEYTAFVAHIFATSRLMHSLGVSEPTDKEVRTVVDDLAKSART
jgi:hypothetical protein